MLAVVAVMAVGRSNVLWTVALRNFARTTHKAPAIDIREQSHWGSSFTDNKSLTCVSQTLEALCSVEVEEECLPKGNKNSKN